MADDDTNIGQTIRAKLLAMPQSQLVDWYLREQRHHNEFCHRAAKWRRQAEALAHVLQPIIEAAEDVDDRVFATLEPFQTANHYDEPVFVSYDLLCKARTVLRKNTDDLSDNYWHVVKAMRVVIVAMKRLESEGNTTAAVAMGKLRQLDPYL
jgi:hypothetical protein